MIKVKEKNGKQYIYQYDTGREVIITPEEGYTVDSIEYFNDTTDLAPIGIIREVDGVLLSDIPNSFLQSENTIQVYLVMHDKEERQTIEYKDITVIPRVKPADYVLEPDDVLTWHSLDERLKILEESGTGGEMNKEQLQEAVNTALTQAKESGAFDGTNGTTPHIGTNGNWFIGETDTGVKAESKDGHTPVKGTDYFTEADKKEITEQVAESVEIPQTLPNPNPLTFTGAVDAVYDGSTPVTVEIPSGEGGVNVDAELREYYTTAKSNIRAAIESKGVAVNDEDSLNDYAGKIALIKTGSDLLDTNVYVADYSISEDIYMTAGVVDIWRRCLVS